MKEREPKIDIEFREPRLVLSKYAAVVVAVLITVFAAVVLYSVSNGLTNGKTDLIFSIVATILAGGIVAMIITAASNIRENGRIEWRIDKAQKRLESHAEERFSKERSGESIQPAWEVARLTLERYWARNLNQNSFIFLTSVFACMLGFSVTIWGIYAMIHAYVGTSGAVVATVAGAVTQAIGATFLVLYRSTAQQALEFNRTLERINSVGMAWYILQTMGEASPKQQVAKDEARSALILAVMMATGPNGAASRQSDFGPDTSPADKPR